MSLLFFDLLTTFLVLILSGKSIYKFISKENRDIFKKSVSLELSIYILIGYLFLSIFSYLLAFHL